MRSLARKIVFFIVGCSVLFSSLWFFKINHLECSLNDQPCPKEVEQELESLRGRPLFFYNPEVVFSSRPTLTQYQLVETEKKLPSTLHLKLLSYPTTYQIRFQENSITYVINAQRHLQEQSLPELLTVSTAVPTSVLVANQEFDPDVHLFLTTLVQALHDTKLEVTELVLEEKHIVRIGLKGGINGIISNERVHYQVNQLAFINQNFDLKTIDQGIKIVDVRYTLPVLRTTYTW